MNTPQLPSVEVSQDVRERILKLHAAYHKPAEIQKIISDEIKQPVPIETVRDITENPRWREQRKLAIERFNDEIFEEPLASKRVRLKMINDMIDEATPGKFEDLKDYIDSKAKLLDLARKETEKKGKEVDAPDLNAIISKLHPYWQQQYIEKKIDLSKVIELVKTGKGYEIPR